MTESYETHKAHPNAITPVHEDPVAPWAHGVAGIVSSSISMALFYPLDFLRTRIHVYKDGNKHPLQSAKQIIQVEGLKGIYRGVTIAMISYSMAWGMYLLIFRTAQQKLFYTTKEKTTPTLGDNRAHNGDAVRDFFSACVAAFITGTLITPLNLLKTRRQLFDVKKYGDPGDTTAHLKNSVKKGGMFSLLRGVGPQILLTGSTTIQITLYEELKRKTFRDNENPLFLEVVFASTLSRVAASTICNPLEVVRTRLQDKRSCLLKGYSSMWTALCTIWRTEGMLGLYRGLPINICRVVPTTVMTVVLYEKSLVAAAKMKSMEMSLPQTPYDVSNDLDTWINTSPID